MVKMIDYKESMMDEIEEALEIAKLDNMQACQTAFHYANDDWDCVPEEFRFQDDPEIEMAYKDSRFEYHLAILLEEMDVGYDLMVLLNMLNEAGDAQLFIVQGKKIRVSFSREKNENTMSLIQNMLFESYMKKAFLT